MLHKLFLSVSLLSTMASRSAPRPAKHVLNNPDKDLQPTHLRPSATDAQKATCKLGQEAKRGRNQLLAADISAYIVERDARIDALAEKHSVTLSFILKSIHASTGYKQTRKPSLHNALLHIKKLEVNRGIEVSPSLVPSSYFC